MVVGTSLLSPLMESTQDNESGRIFRELKSNDECDFPLVSEIKYMS